MGSDNVIVTERGKVGTGTLCGAIACAGGAGIAGTLSQDAAEALLAWPVFATLGFLAGVSTLWSP